MVIKVVSTVLGHWRQAFKAIVQNWRSNAGRRHQRLFPPELSVAAGYDSIYGRFPGTVETVRTAWSSTATGFGSLQSATRLYCPGASSVSS